MANLLSTAITGTLSTTGSVGIGTTSPFSANGKNLHIQDSLAPRVILDNTAASGRYYTIESGNTGNFIVYDADAGSTRFLINSSGNVGIGTTAPSGKLHVYGGRIVIDNTLANQSAIQFNQAGTEMAVLYRPGNISNQIRMYTSSGGDVMTWNQGNVGINTISPIDKLHIVGGLTSTSIAVPSNTSVGSLQFGYDGTKGLIRSWNSSPIVYQAYNYQSWETSGVERMRITSEGNVGIGTTSPGYKLSVNGAAGIEGNEEYLYFHSTYSVGSNARAKIRAVGAGGGSGYGGDLRISTRAQNNVWNENAVTVDSSGNVGIGTTAPGGRLHIATPDPATNFVAIDFRNPTYGIYGKSNSISRRGNTLEFTATDYNTNGSVVTREVLTLRPEGNVGIGTTSPTGALHVVGSAGRSTKIYYDMYLYNTLVLTDGSFNAQSGVGGTSGHLLLFSNGLTERMRITSTGNVGIGTTSPLVSLDVRGTAIITNPAGSNYNENLRLPQATSGYAALTLGGSIAASGTSASQWTILKYPTNDNFAIRNNNSDLVYITTGGNVGIGTTAPSYKLHVDGTGLFIADSVDARVLRLRDRAANGGNIVQFEDGSGTGVWEVVGRSNEFYIYKNTGTGAGYKYRVNSNGDHNWDSGKMFLVNSSGSLGIGTTSPGEMLEVTGNVRFATGGSSSWGNGLLTINSGWGAGKYPTIGSYGGSSGSLIMLHNPHVPFRTDNAATTSYTGRSGLRMAIDTSATNWWDAGLAGDFYHIFKSGVGEFLRITNNGNVGIGTTTPLSKLQIGSVGATNYSVPNGLAFGDGTRAAALNVDSAGLNIYSSSHIILSPNTIERVRITTDGNVGINTTSPSEKLDVSGNAKTSGYVLVNNHSNNALGYRISNTSGTSVSAMFVNSANALVIGSGTFDQVQLNRKTLISGASLGVNVAASATAGRIDASNDIVAYSSSDERLKHNITPIDNALDKVKSLTGVEFDWKPEYKDAHGYEGHDTGIIAQQVEAVMPSAVRTNDTGFLAVRYEKLIGLLIEANKELAARVEELENKLG